MELRFSQEQQMVQQMVRDFAEKEAAPFIERMEKGEFPRELLKRMSELGLMGMTIPEEYGGSNMDFTSYILTIHELSKVSASPACSTNSCSPRWNRTVPCSTT